MYNLNKQDAMILVEINKLLSELDVRGERNIDIMYKTMGLTNAILKKMVQQEEENSEELEGSEDENGDE